MKIDVAFLPKDVNEITLSETVCIVLDVFRATTSIITAMDNGCKTIIPVLSIEEARNLADQIGPVLLAGERQSITIEDFDFGNSPFEFSQDKVMNQKIIMTTTNGTIAIKATEGSYRTLIGAFINAQAVCRQARQYKKDILIVCAGTDRLFSLEDALCAGLLIKLLSESEDGKNKPVLTDSAHGAFLMYTQAKNSLIEMASQSRNGRRLYDLGRENDVQYCFQTDLLQTVPEYKERKITRAD